MKMPHPLNFKLTGVEKRTVNNNKKKKTATKNTLNCSMQGLDSKKQQDKNRIRSLVQSIQKADQNNEIKSQS